MTFTVVDSTKGFSRTTGAMKVIGDSTTKSFYDGSTSEYISEQPGLSDGSQLKLRKPSRNSTRFTGATANGKAATSFDAVRVNEVDRTSGSNPVQNSGFTGASTWDDTWIKCNGPSGSQT